MSWEFNAMSATDRAMDEAMAAYGAGRRVGFGISALALSLVAFLSLLGAEKAILAVVLGVLAVRGGRSDATARKLGAAAIGIAVAFLATLVVVLVLYWDRLAELVELLNRLS
jgi:hypothetical protein